MNEKQKLSQMSLGYYWARDIRTEEMIVVEINEWESPAKNIMEREDLDTDGIEESYRTLDSINSTWFHEVPPRLEIIEKIEVPDATVCR